MPPILEALGSNLSLYRVLCVCLAYLAHLALVTSVGQFKMRINRDSTIIVLKHSNHRNQPGTAFVWLWLFQSKIHWLPWVLASLEIIIKLIETHESLFMIEIGFHPVGNCANDRWMFYTRFYFIKHHLVLVELFFKLTNGCSSSCGGLHGGMWLTSLPAYYIKLSRDEASFRYKNKLRFPINHARGGWSWSCT